MAPHTFMYRIPQEFRVSSAPQKSTREVQTYDTLSANLSSVVYTHPSLHPPTKGLCARKGERMPPISPFHIYVVVVVVVVCFSVLWPSPMVHVVAGVAGVAPVSWFVSWDVCVNVENGRQWCWRFRGLEYLLPTNGRTSTIIPPSTSPRTQI